jgi:hypothetical protein
VRAGPVPVYAGGFLLPSCDAHMGSNTGLMLVTHGVSPEGRGPTVGVSACLTL